MLTRVDENFFFFLPDVSWVVAFAIGIGIGDLKRKPRMCGGLTPIRIVWSAFQLQNTCMGRKVVHIRKEIRNVAIRAAGIWVHGVDEVHCRGPRVFVSNASCSCRFQGSQHPRQHRWISLGDIWSRCSRLFLSFASWVSSSWQTNGTMRSAIWLPGVCDCCCQQKRLLTIA